MAYKLKKKKKGWEYNLVKGDVIYARNGNKYTIIRKLRKGYKIVPSNFYVAGDK